MWLDEASGEVSAVAYHDAQQAGSAENRERRKPKTEDNHMSHIAVFLAPGFEEIEALTVVDFCRRAEIATDMVAIGDDLRVTGSHDITVEADKVIGEVDFDALDAIVLPGGPGHKNLEACDALMAQVRAFDKAGKRICAICAAPGILARAGLLKGRKAVSHPTAEADLEANGATLLKEETVWDGHVLTGRGMGTAMAFALAIAEAFAGKEKAQAIADGIVYRKT